jgi:beta-glucosidase
MPWLDSVSAVLQAWYPGQEQGNALASVLFGDANPSGKLPLTFPRSLDQTPTSTPERYPGVEGVVTYSEGVFVGYRWYDANNVEPLFPFGHGLSYTNFQYADLLVERGTAAQPNTQPPYVVSFTVTNSGARAGAEVAEVYTGALPDNPQTPPRQLAAFAKVSLAPGQSQRVSVEVSPRSLSFWNAQTHAWQMSAGVVPLYVGSSSRDIRLTGDTAIRPGGGDQPAAPAPAPAPAPSPDNHGGGGLMDIELLWGLALVLAAAQLQAWRASRAARRAQLTAQAGRT